MFKRTYLNVIILSILTGLIILFFFDILFLDNVFCFRDIYRYFYPYKLYASNCIRSGEVPLWNPYISSGSPFFATLQSQVFYPLSIIHYILPFNYGFQLFIIIHFFFAGLFVYILCNELKLSPLSSFTSAIIFTFSGYLVSVVDMVSTLSSVIWLPLVFMCFHKALFENLAHKKFFYILLLSVLIGIEFLGGEPTIIYGTVILLIVYNTIFIKQKNSVYILPVAGIISLLLVAFQFLPFMELLRYSDRIHLSAKISYQSNLFWSLPPEHIFNFFIPKLFGDITKRYVGSYDISQLWLKSFYIGILPLILSIYALLNLRKEKEKRKVKIMYFFTGVFIVSILLSFGSYNFLYRIFYDFLPGFKLIRYPVKFLFLATFSISIIAGFGIDYILNKKDNKNLIIFRNIILFILGFFGLLVGMLYLFKEPILIFYKKNFFPDIELSNVYRLVEEYSIIFDSLFQTVIFLLIGLILIICIVKKKLNVKIAGVLIVMGLTIDLFINGFTLNPRLSKEIYNSKSESVKLVDKDKSFYRVMIYLKGQERFFLFGETFEETMRNANLIFYPNQNMQYKIYFTGGYESINVKRYNDFFNAVIKKPKTRYLSLINAKYLFTNKDLELSLLKLVKDFKVVKIYKNDVLLPHCYFTRNIKLVNNERDAFSYIFSDEFDPRKEVVIEGRGVEVVNNEKNASLADKDIVNIEEYKSNIVKIKADISQDGMIVLNDTYYPGWRVYVDGQEEKIYPANYIYRGVQVKKGNHKIEFIFRPATFVIGAIISLISFLGVLITLILLKKRR
ncbi:MAG: YfhO family protein [Candidatus Firestonebacteria bacterium]